MAYSRVFSAAMKEKKLRASHSWGSAKGNKNSSKVKKSTSGEKLSKAKTYELNFYGFAPATEHQMGGGGRFEPRPLCKQKQEGQRRRSHQGAVKK